MNLNQLAQELEISAVRTYDKSHSKASGEWAESVRCEVDGQTLRLFAADYTGAFTNGRSPNKNQDHVALHRFVGWAGSTFLRTWVLDKGISASPFAIAYKIAREGFKASDPDFLKHIIEDFKPSIQEYLKTETLKYVKSISKLN